MEMVFEAIKYVVVAWVATLFVAFIASAIFGMVVAVRGGEVEA